VGIGTEPTGIDAIEAPERGRVSIDPMRRIVTMQVVKIADQSNSTLNDGSILLALCASCLGWSLDLFDLFLLLYIAPYVGKAFFPPNNPTLILAAVYASFAVTLLTRPIGSAIFGSYADTHGRKQSMVISMVGVGLTTAAFGILPGYAKIGVFSPVVFLALRLVQGIFFGGVIAATHTIGTESVPKKWRGLASGLVGSGGAGVGALLASFAFLVTSSIFTEESFANWGWRVMFLCGITSSIFGLILFRFLEESPLWKKIHLPGEANERKNRTESPVRILFSTAHRKTMFTNILVTSGAGGAYYITSGYMPTFLRVVNHVGNKQLSIFLIGGAVISIFSGVIIGYLTETLGRRRILILIGVPGIFLVPLCFILLASSTTINLITFYSLTLAFFGNAVLAPIPIFLNERFTTAIRASGTGLSWNIGFAIGGIMPTLVTLASSSPDKMPITLAIFAVAIFSVYIVGSVAGGETGAQNM
jgi:MFS transporter, MHS family, proline/betaine transporter